jgi:ATP-dependent protease ClpP protease subunit
MSRFYSVYQAFGTAALLLSLGSKGHRTCMPNACIMFKGNRNYIRNTNQDIFNSKRTLHHMLAGATGQDIHTVRRELAHTRYFSPLEAMKFGLVDKVRIGKCMCACFPFACVVNILLPPLNCVCLLFNIGGAWRCDIT